METEYACSSKEIRCQESGHWEALSVVREAKQMADRRDSKTPARCY